MMRTMRGSAEKRYGRLGKVLVLVASTAVFYIVRLHNIDNPVQHRNMATTDAAYQGMLGDDDEVGKFLAGPERIIPLNERKPDNEIRYAAFGSSVTWGAGLAHREEEAYVWKLTNLDYERGKNYGIRATGPNYPAACISTMIGDAEDYDVIILEYFMRGPEGVLTLAKRLRERFPDAIIIMTRLWGPYQIQNKHVHENISAWATDNEFGRGYIHDPKFADLFIKSGVDNWQYRFHKNSKDGLLQYQEDAARETGSYLIKMPFNERAEGPGGWIEIGDKLLAHDSFHLSAAGHQDIANRVKAIVDKVGVPKKTAVQAHTGSVSADYCHNWLLSGIIGEGLRFSPNSILYQMEHTDKYAVSFENSNEGDNWMEVDNPSDLEMDFFIAYMTTGPPPSKYPKVEAIRGDTGETFLLEPDSVGWAEMSVHISRLGGLGRVAPRTTVHVNFNALEDTEWPFRIVHAILTPANEKQTESFSGGDGEGLISVRGNSFQ
jgi:hypothetical protein